MTARTSATRTRPAVATLVAALALPTVVAAAGVVSLGDRADAVRELPAAVVNLDEPVTTEQAGTVAAGRLLAAGLTRPGEGDPDPGMDWVLADATSAREGLEDGSFHAVVTIPADFSATVAKISTDSPEQAGVTVRTNRADATVVGTITTDVAQVAADSLGRTITTSYLSGLLAGTGELGGKLHDAASGADELTDGAERLDEGLGKLGDGAGSLADGAGRAADGAGSLARGARDAADGAQRLEKGAVDAADGAGSLADGTRELATGTDRLDAGLDDLADGAASLKGGSAELADGARDVDAGARTLAEGLGGLAAATRGLESQSSTMAEGAAQVATGVKGWAQVLRGWGGACADPRIVAAVPALCDATEEALGPDGARADALVSGAGDLSDGTQALAGSAPELRAGIVAADEGADDLAEGTAALSAGASRLASGAADLASGTSSAQEAAAKLAAGSSRVADGSASLAEGTAKLAEGSTSLADGTSKLAGGSATLADGTSELARGGLALRDGAAGARQGASRLADGSASLAEGLAAGAAQVPTTDPDSAAARAATVAQPVVAAAEDSSPTGGRASVAPTVLASALWLGAFGAFLAVPALRRRELSRAATARGTVTRALAPALLVGAVQVALTVGAVHLLDLDPARPWTLALVAAPATALAALTVTQAVVALCGQRLGALVVLALTCVQVLALPGFLPLDAAPGWLRGPVGSLPVPLAGDALGWAFSASGAGTAVAGLLLWSVAGLLVSTWAASRRGSVTLADLRRQVTAPA